MKIWLDDIRPAPNGYVHCHSVNEAIELIKTTKEPIELLDYLAETEQYYPVKLHTMNPVGRKNMQRLINRYWK